MLLTSEDYRKTPWKNGGGITEDVLLLPQGSSHEDFDIRISRAPIVDESRFSVFPGIDRTITRLGENPLTLCFSDGQETELPYLWPLSFDSALAPSSRLPAGASRVMNVMTRRGRWQAHVCVLRGPAREKRDVPPGGMIVAHAAKSGCRVSGIQVGEGQTLIVDDMLDVLIATDAGSACLVAAISPESAR
ncbi:HutD family protein [Pseudaminobacter arsenicus]|uniref:HutD family protein n=1 Tax=Borborobacter arsenicus TaxID=1851146 RepID=A0A432V816_9HYPH|nr:HutD family protein [Pseudaminobacter arsenicus]RUM98308.1 HutD family protein [Pseudaminobacter arsenicus]